MFTLFNNKKQSIFNLIDRLQFPWLTASYRKIIELVSIMRIRYLLKVNS